MPLNAVQSINSKLAAIFHSTAHYKSLLTCRGRTAQALLDGFQMLLDRYRLNARLRSNLAVALKRISSNTGFYTQGFELEDIDADIVQVTGGSFADIYKGKFRGEVVCIKTMRVYDPDQVDRLIKEFSREAILWRQLSHPNVLPFYGLCRFHSRLSFVSPWAKNGHVLKYLKSNPKKNRILLCLDAAAGVEYLHKNGIIHGDLKAVNILVDSAGRGVLADFGLSAVSDPQILHWTSHSMAASTGGTIRWQAPELQGVGQDQVVPNTPASDVYALGCVYYELFTELSPFHELPRDALVLTHVREGKRPSKPAWSDPAWTERGLTIEMWDLVTQCWVHNPAKRPWATTIVRSLFAQTGVDKRPPGTWAANDIRVRSVCHSQDNLLAVVENILQRILNENPGRPRPGREEDRSNAQRHRHSTIFSTPQEQRSTALFTGESQQRPDLDETPRKRVTMRDVRVGGEQHINPGHKGVNVRRMMGPGAMPSKPTFDDRSPSISTVMRSSPRHRSPATSHHFNRGVAATSVVQPQLSTSILDAATGPFQSSTYSESKPSTSQAMLSQTMSTDSEEDFEEWCDVAGDGWILCVPQYPPYYN